MTPLTKVSGLTGDNIAALREVLEGEVRESRLELTATTATFYGTAADACRLVARAIADTPGRGHPRASLHAVLRKLTRAVDVDTAAGGTAA